MPLDQAIAKLGVYDWLIFTSANGVRFFLERLDRSAVDLRALRARICAIGPATRAAIEALHLKVDVMGKDYVAEGLLAAFAAHDLAGQRILLPRAAVARDLVPVELARRGARGGRGGSLPHRGSRPAAFDLAGEAGLDHIHQFFDSAELRGHGGGGSSRRREGGLHRAGHLRHRARVGN